MNFEIYRVKRGRFSLGWKNKIVFQPSAGSNPEEAL
jgi:hypothetical protein